MFFGGFLGGGAYGCRQHLYLEWVFLRVARYVVFVKEWYIYILLCSCLFTCCRNNPRVTGGSVFLNLRALLAPRLSAVLLFAASPSVHGSACVFLFPPVFRGGLSCSTKLSSRALISCPFPPLPSPLPPPCLSHPLLSVSLLLWFSFLSLVLPCCVSSASRTRLERRAGGGTVSFFVATVGGFRTEQQNVGRGGGISFASSLPSLRGVCRRFIFYFIFSGALVDPSVPLFFMRGAPCCSWGVCFGGLFC